MNDHHKGAWPGVLFLCIFLVCLTALVPSARVLFKARELAAPFNRDSVLALVDKLDTDGGGTGISGYNKSLLQQFASARVIRPESFGAVGDGLTDDTHAIMRAFEAARGSASIIDFGSGTYLVSKSHEPALYPKGDEPCLYLCGEDSLCLYGDGACLKVSEHGQGLLEILDSKNIVITGIEFAGCGDFPKLDADSGLGEKGTVGEGYHNAESQYQFSLFKNNSVDTSAYTGFGSDGEESWGTFGGGFIGNCADGVLVYGESENVLIAGCTFHGFNHNGVEVGTRTVETPDYSRGITVCGCTFFNLYNAGVQLILADNCVVADNRIHEIGHPDALPKEGKYLYPNADPGYGIACAVYQRKNDFFMARNILVLRNEIDHVVRKGIDSHGCDTLYVIENRIDSACAFGIDIISKKISACLSTNVHVLDNIVLNSGQKGCPINVYAYDLAPNAVNRTEVANNCILNSQSHENYGAINIQGNCEVSCKDNRVVGCSGGYGLKVCLSKTVRVAGNLLSCNALEEAALGILYSKDVQVEDNAFCAQNCPTLYKAEDSSGSVRRNSFTGYYTLSETQESERCPDMRDNLFSGLPSQ